MSRFGSTSLSGEVIRTTDAAILFQIDDAEYWIPRKVCIDGDAVDVGDNDLIVADWFLEKEGIS